MSEEVEYKKTNREKKLTPKLGKFWCMYCDRDIVGKGQRCRTCGKRDPNKAHKKE